MKTDYYWLICYLITNTTWWLNIVDKMNICSVSQISFRYKPKWSCCCFRFSGQFLGINPNARFLNDDQQLEGIHLVTSFRQVRQLQVRLGECAEGPTDFFPAMWSVNLLPENISILETEPHFVIPKPCGTRYLLYVLPVNFFWRTMRKTFSASMTITL